MKISCKSLFVEKKVAKNGSKYRLVHLLITIDGQEQVRRIAVFTADTKIA